MEDKEEAYLKEIEQLKGDLVSKQYEHHDQMNQEEKKQLKENKELDSHNQSRIMEVKKNVYQVARNMVVEEKVSNEEKNDQLRTKLAQLQQELSVIKKNRN